MQKPTEKWLLDHLIGITERGNLCSKGKRSSKYYLWGYAVRREGDKFMSVKYRDEANLIYVIDETRATGAVYSINLPKYARNKGKNAEAQKLIKEWEDGNKKRKADEEK